jgi:hypothetical protein
MRPCWSCGACVEDRFRFCPSCSAPLRRKLVEFFRPHARDAGHALRVSWYLEDDAHVRFSVWDEDGRALAAISLEPEEARRLGALLRRRAPERRRASVSERLSAFLR